MSRLTRSLVALAAVTFLVAPGTASARSPDARSDTGLAAMGSDDQMVAEAMALERKWVQLWNDRNWDDLGTTLYADDALAVPPNHEPIRGRAAIIEYLRGARDALGEFEGGTETFRASASGNLVSLVGEYSARSGKLRLTGHELFERQPDGPLRCTVDMFGFRDPLA